MPLESLLLLSGKLAFGAAGLWAGLRLAAQVRAGESWSVHVLAAAAILVGGTGLALIPLGQALGGGIASALLVAGGDVAMRAGLIALGVFTWRVFRPEGPLPLLLLIGCAAFQVAAMLWDWTAQPSWASYDDALASAHAVQLSIAAPFLWSSIETGLEAFRSRRRAALGLAPGAVVRQFRVWTLATASFVGICALAIAAGEASAAGWTRTAALATSLRGVLYFLITACVWDGLLSRRREAQRASTRAQGASSAR
jgi:hypothetical protein